MHPNYSDCFFILSLIISCFDAAGIGPQVRFERALRRLRSEFHFILRSVGRSSTQLFCVNRLLDHRDNAFSKTVSQVTKIKISLRALRLLDRKFVFRIFAPTYFLRQYPRSVVFCRTITNFAELSRRMATYLFSESVSLILTEESGKFKCAGITQRSSPCIAYIVLI